MFFRKIGIAIWISQIFFLGAFWLSDWQYYVVETEKKLCWVFTRWITNDPNWLPEGWKAVFLYDEIFTKFLWNLQCENWYVSHCCKELWYRYAGVPIGQYYISNERSGAEFLASKKVINVKSFNPHEYKLEDKITRKEIMKVIINLSEKELQEECREIFADVANDWGCKYIETALENGFITWNRWFRPDDFVTQTEALKLILQARWIGKKYETDNWREDYISTAYYLWYIDKKFSDYNTFASRGWIFSAAARTYSDFSY